MVALNGFNSTQNNDLVPTETINRYVIPVPNYTRVYEAISWICPATGTAHNWPRFDAPSAAPATHTESDELTAANYPTSAETVNGAIVATYAFASDQLAAKSALAPMETQIGIMAEELRNKIDLDVLATLVGASNASDNSGSNLSLDLWETALAAFMAQKVQGPRFAFVGSSNQIRDFRKAVRQAGGAALVSMAGLEVFNGLPNSGYIGSYMGIEIYQGNTTQYDGTNDAGGFVSVGAPAWSFAESMDLGGQFQVGSGLGLAMWNLRGQYGISAQTMPTPERQGTKLVASAMYGASITADHLVRAFISKKAA